MVIQLCIVYVLNYARPNNHKKYNDYDVTIG